MSNNRTKIQTRVTEYHKWVIERLIGIDGKNEADVLSRMVQDWVNDHEERLTARGLSVRDYQAAMARQREAAAARDGVLSYNAHKERSTTDAQPGGDAGDIEEGQDSQERR